MKIAVLGMGPLPGQDASRVHAPGLRTAQFVRGLLAGKHDVSLALRLYENADADPSAPLPPDMKSITYAALSDEEFMTGPRLAKLLDEWKPRAIVAVTFLPAFRAVQVAYDLPVWADLFGDPLAEGQAKAALLGEDETIQHHYDMLTPILERGDRFSAVSRAQSSALEGQLAMSGRMSRRTAYYRMTQTIPCSLDPAITPLENDPLRGELVPEDSFVVLWSGGFNTWCDVDTLFLGIEKAMARTNKMHFVATGGDLGEQDTSTYLHFTRLVEHSNFKERFHLQGWVPYSSLMQYYALADVAVNSDRSLLEVRLGTKTRFMEWIACRVPIITSRLSELSRELERSKGALAFPPGDAEALSSHLLWASSHPEELKKMAAKAYAHASNRFNVEHTTRALVQWARRPRRSPDWRSHISLASDSRQKVTRELELTRNHAGNLEKHIEELKEAVIGARHTGDLAQQETRKLDELLAQERQQSAELGQDISKLVIDRDHWKNQFQAQEKLFTQLREGLEQQIAQQKELIDEVSKQLRYWEGVVRKRDTKISDLEHKITEMHREFAEFKAMANSQSQELSRLGSELTARGEQVAELKAWGEKVRSTIPYRLYNLVRRHPEE